MLGSNLLEYKKFRDLRGSLVLGLAALIAYWTYHPETGHSGSTWLGYVLGGAGLFIILFHLWYGVYKRRPPARRERRRARDQSSVLRAAITNRRASRVVAAKWQFWRNSTRQGWLSVHVYYGVVLLLVVSLHTGFHFGWNVHTLAYGLMVGVILTGLVVVHGYLRAPRQMTENLAGDTLESLLHKIERLQEQAVSLSAQLPAEFLALVRQAVKQTKVGGSVLEQLYPGRFSCPTHTAVLRLQEMAGQLDPAHEAVHRELYATLLRVESLLDRARVDVSLRARLEFCLYLHVPLSIALTVALTAHVLAVVLYW